MDKSVISARHYEHGAKASNDAVERKVQHDVLVVLGHCQLAHSLDGKAHGDNRVVSRM
jgi:hypothetical protein